MIAILVPCWNKLWYTQKMVESVQRNSEGHLIKFFFVDNGSTDGTHEYLSRIEPKAPVITNPVNIGVNAAWNQLFLAALSEDPSVICLANNDILAGPGWLDPVVRELRKGDKRYFLPNGKFFSDTTFDSDVRSEGNKEAGKTVPARAGWCMFFRPEAVRLFYPIPSCLTLWFGDDYMHLILGKYGYSCWALLDSYCLHYISKSIADYPDMVKVVDKDRKAFAELTKNV